MQYITSAIPYGTLFLATKFKIWTVFPGVKYFMKQETRLALMFIAIVNWTSLSTRSTCNNNVFLGEFEVLFCAGPYNANTSSSKKIACVPKQSCRIEYDGCGVCFL